MTKRNNKSNNSYTPPESVIDNSYLNTHHSCGIGVFARREFTRFSCTTINGKFVYFFKGGLLYREEDDGTDVRQRPITQEFLARRFNLELAPRAIKEPEPVFSPYDSVTLADVRIKRAWGTYRVNVQLGDDPASLATSINVTLLIRNGYAKVMTKLNPAVTSVVTQKLEAANEREVTVSCVQLDPAPRKGGKK